jgi:hypothetical protein
VTTTEVNALSATDASNTSISGISIAELCASANINDAQRATLGAIARMYQRDHATATVGGTANAITLAYTSGPSSYVTGEKFAFIATGTNSSTTTVNVSTLGAKNVFRQTANGPAACVGGEIITGQIVELEYDGTQFQIISAVPQAVPTASYLRGYLSGCILSNDGVTPNTKLDVSAGIAMDSTNVFLINLSATVINFGVTGAAGLDTGSIAASTWYHIYAIAKADGTASAIASTSASSPTMPAGYIYKRRIGSARADGSAHLLTFNQLGDQFLWLASTLDISAATTSATAALQGLTVPTGVQVLAEFHAFVRDGGTAAATSVLFTSPDENDQSGSTFFDLVTPSVASAYSAGSFRRRTNTSGADPRAQFRHGGKRDRLYLWLDRRSRQACLTEVAPVSPRRGAAKGHPALSRRIHLRSYQTCP